MATQPAQSTKDSTAPYEKASATLLSEQPNEIENKQVSQKEQQNWDLLRGHLESRLNMLRAWRTSWWNDNYSDLAIYIEPRRSIWLTQSAGGMASPNNMGRGRKINNAIVDPTGTYAVRVCSSGIMSGLASPSRPWFKLIPPKNIAIDSEGRKWLDEVEDRIYTVLAGSNFYNSFAQECEDLVVFGTAPIIIYEDDKDLIRLYNPTVGEYYLSSSSTMRVDGLFRTFVMTVSQMVEFFELENCPKDVQELWSAKGASLEVERIVGHAIEPNFGVSKTDAGQVPGNFSWREVYWLYGSGCEKPFSMRGFVDQPFTAARWSTQSNDAYGRSVGMDVLPDIIQLQVETLRKAEAIEKQVRPPLIADMALKNQPSSILPGHVTYVPDLGPGKGMRPIYDVNPDISGMMKDIAEIQERIKKGFFNDVMTPLMSNPGDRRTAYESAQIVSEKLSIMGPVIENILSESLKPKLKRIFGILKRKDIFPPVPKSLQGVPLDLDFISMLALANKASATGGLERLTAFIGNLVPVFPDAKNYLNLGEMINTMNQYLDNPEKILNGPEVIQQMAQAQQAAAQKAQAQADMAHGVQTAGVAAQSAQVLANTNVGDGQNALNQLLSGGSAQ